MTKGILGAVPNPIPGGYIVETSYSRQYNWQPQPDITAYELALCLPVLVGTSGHGVGEQIDKLPAEARRHFVEANE